MLNPPAKEEVSNENEDEDGEKEVEEVGNLSRWGWLGAVYEFADKHHYKEEEVWEMGIIQFLNRLSYDKEKNDLIEQLNKKKT